MTDILLVGLLVLVLMAVFAVGIRTGMEFSYRRTKKLLRDLEEGSL